ncbi:MAG: aminoglycoside phosphotransferase family protein [Chloroflexi bacterium]|nr:aminoglycoside phosphotransferase family protein [Chloroflexota bacterium]
MQRHPHFALWLHEDAQLSALLGAEIVGRTMLHEWPLSCVQRLRLAGGATRIYKVQAPPTVEPAFYARACSPLLVAAQLIEHGEGLPALLMEEVQAPRLTDIGLPAAEALAIGRAALAQIAAIRGHLPALADLRTAALWLAYWQTVLDDLSQLAEAGVFVRVDQALMRGLTRQGAASDVLAAFESPIGYVHGDLTAGNLFVTHSSLRVIDWQRPLWGPTALDLVCLLDSLALDPRAFLDEGVVRLFYLLRIAWLTQCARRWFPAGAATYDSAIVRLAARLVA